MIASGARRVTDAMFLAAARALADLSPARNDPTAALLPPLEQIVPVSRRVAEAVAAASPGRRADRAWSIRGPRPADRRPLVGASLPADAAGALRNWTARVVLDGTPVRVGPSFGDPASRLHGTEGCKADVLMQNVDLSESYLPQQIELKHQWSWRIFFLDVGKDVVPIRFVFELGEIFAILMLHQLLDGGDRALDKVKHPERTAGVQCSEKSGVDRMPL